VSSSTTSRDCPVETTPERYLEPSRTEFDRHGRGNRVITLRSSCSCRLKTPVKAARLADVEIWPPVRDWRSSRLSVLRGAPSLLAWGLSQHPEIDRRLRFSSTMNGGTALEGPQRPVRPPREPRGVLDRVELRDDLAAALLRADDQQVADHGPTRLPRPRRGRRRRICARTDARSRARPEPRSRSTPIVYPTCRRRCSPGLVDLLDPPTSAAAAVGPPRPSFSTALPSRTTRISAINEDAFTSPAGRVGLFIERSQRRRA